VIWHKNYVKKFARSVVIEDICHLQLSLPQSLLSTKAKRLMNDMEIEKIYNKIAKEKPKPQLIYAVLSQLP
jgi:hypothetical protein